MYITYKKKNICFIIMNHHVVLGTKFKFRTEPSDGIRVCGHAMGAAPIAYSVARFRSTAIFHSTDPYLGTGIWCSDGQNLNLAVG